MAYAGTPPPPLSSCFTASTYDRHRGRRFDSSDPEISHRRSRSRPRCLLVWHLSTSRDPHSLHFFALCRRRTCVANGQNPFHRDAAFLVLLASTAVFGGLLRRQWHHQGFIQHRTTPAVLNRNWREAQLSRAAPSVVNGPLQPVSARCT